MIIYNQKREVEWTPRTQVLKVQSILSRFKVVKFAAGHFSELKF